MDTLFSSPDLFDNLHEKAMNGCGTVTAKLKTNAQTEQQ
jgi:hypothetical protein